MELAYLYVDQYRGFANTELNFSQEIDVHYDYEEMILTGNRKKQSIPKGFWGQNINSLTMLVGNNGAGKTSLMQYLISIFQGIFEQKDVPGGYILVIRDGEDIYYCEKLSGQIEVCGNDGLTFIRKTTDEISAILSTSKLIYLTNALSFDDIKRGRQKDYGRYCFLYDCSVGGLLASDARMDVDTERRQRTGTFSEVETYFLYEQYKQIKFVFDKNQYCILKDMAEEHYPVPLPQKLYIDLLADSQLGEIFPDKDISKNIEEKYFGERKSKLHGQLWKYIHFKCFCDELLSDILKYLFCRSCLWAMLRSMARRMDNQLRTMFWDKLSRQIEGDASQEREFCEVSDIIWGICEHDFPQMNDDWKDFSSACKPCYNNFFRYIEKEDALTKHIKLEMPIEQLRMDSDIQLSVTTTDDPDWFIEFLNKYRYTANPDYYLHFHWGLSSGENNLLSTFASFYYIFGADYTNKNNGTYTIYNKLENEKYQKCDNVILLIDEADLAYHPEWQREYIALLTAFLVRVYPSSCCKNIQIILSTHSPILLGDVPRQNVIYLRKGEHGQGMYADSSVELETFGQNILLLLQNSFFLKDGTMGRFAYNIINHEFQELSKLEKKIDTELREEGALSQADDCMSALEGYRQFAGLIGEPILRRNLRLQIRRIQNKLSPEDTARYLSDEQLERQLHILQTEMGRREQEREEK